LVIQADLIEDLTDDLALKGCHFEQHTVALPSRNAVLFNRGIGLNFNPLASRLDLAMA